MDGLPYIKRYFDFSTILSLDEFNQQFDQIPKNNVSLEEGDAISSVGYIEPHKDSKFFPFYSFIYQNCLPFYPVITEDTAKYYITRSWANRHLRTGKTAEHRHEGVELVFSCYVTVPKHSGAFELYYNGQWHAIPVETNDVLIFPGNLIHRTEISLSDLPRIVITLNITQNLHMSIQRVEEIYKTAQGQPAIEDLHKEFINMVGRIADCAARIETQLIGME